MKITFPDQSYIAMTKTSSGKVIVTIVARDSSKPLASVANSVELTMEQFLELTKL